MSNRRSRAKVSPVRQAAAQRAQKQSAGSRSGRGGSRWVVVGAVVAVVLVAVGITVAVTQHSSSTPAVKPSADAVRLGCASCHTTDGRVSEGPTWKGLWGSRVALSDGRTVVADDAYIRRSILDPAADNVQGFPGGMTTTAVTPAELDRLVAFIKSLGTKS